MKPTFVLSIDEELVWGSFDHMRAEAFSKMVPDPRGVVRELLQILCDFRISATWAIVGHLFLDRCERGPDGRAHPDIPRPKLNWYGDWFDKDPCTDQSKAPLWYGRDLVDMVASAPVPQEIGSHSFSHIPFGDAGCTREVAEADIISSVEAARKLGISLRSFVFPRNLEGHHDVLAKHGFIAFRGRDPWWFRDLPRQFKRACHLLDELMALPPPIREPSEFMPGLWNIPGSMILLPRHGMRRAIPMSSRIRKARAGIRRVLDQGGVFHLWFHPFNFGVDRDAMFAGLRTILQDVVSHRNAGLMSTLTMGETAAHCSSRSAATQSRDHDPSY